MYTCIGAPKVRCHSGTPIRRPATSPGSVLFLGGLFRMSVVRVVYDLPIRIGFRVYIKLK